MNTHIGYVAFQSLQRFIFATPTLLDAVGRSALIESLTSPDQPDVVEALKASGAQFHQRGAGAFSVTGAHRQVHDFIARFTTAVRARSSMLEVGAVVLPASVASPGDALRRAALQPRPGLRPTVPYSVARCSYTGMPVDLTMTDRGSLHAAVRGRGADSTSGRRAQRVATELRAQRLEGRRAHRELLARDDVAAVLLGASKRIPRRLTLPLDMDAVAPDVGTSTSAAMVVADINSLGTWLGCLDADDRVAVGQEIRQVMGGVVCDVIAAIAAGVSTDEGRRVVIVGRPDDIAIPLAAPKHAQRRDRRLALPVRPLIGGGDDLAFVVESRLTWSVVHAIFAAFHTRVAQSQVLRDADLADLRIGIGAAIVPAGSSLLRAHDIAEGRLAAAKHHDRGVSAFAWQNGERVSGSLAGKSQSAVYEWQGERPEASWHALRAAADPALDGSLRSAKAADGSERGWAERRSWLHALRARIGRQHDERAGVPPALRDEIEAKLEHVKDIAYVMEHVIAEPQRALDAIQLAREDLILPGQTFTTPEASDAA